ncbi:MAG: Na+/H+ antiporter subunit E [Chlamydiota bacterium]
MIPFCINMIIALFWSVLVRDVSLFQVILGYLIGLVLLSIYSIVVKQLDYTRRFWAFLQFAVIFLYAFIKANIEVAVIILFVPKSKINPSTFSYDTSSLSKMETLLLSHVISLTPGTITVDVSPSNSSLLIHSLHFIDPVQTEKEITNQYKKKILRFTR